MDLLNHVGDVDLGIHNFAEFPPLVSHQKLKNMIVHVTGRSDGAEISSIGALYDEINDRRTPRAIDQQAHRPQSLDGRRENRKELTNVQTNL